MRGKFITFEGGDGAGKTTQIDRLAERLKAEGHDVVITREPGGSAGAEAVRHILLSGAAEGHGADAEVMLFAAARLDHLQQLILPALTSGKTVLCDRFYDSTRAYQGANGTTDNDFITRMEKIAVGTNKPDKTIILDLPAEVGLQRVQARVESNRKNGKETLDANIDRFEKEALEVHTKRREIFQKIAKTNPKRCSLIDANRDIDAIAEDVWDAVSPVFNPSIKKPARAG